jgi:phenylacetate-CoA ligase
MDELISYQNAALRKLVNHAYSTVTFYKKLFDEHCLHPKEIQSIEDISKIPVIDKKVMTGYSYKDLISNYYSENNLIPIKTAGSNGMPFRFFIDPSFDQFRKAQFLRPYFTNGRRLFDHSVCFSLYGSWKKKWFQHIGLLPETRIQAGPDLNEEIKILQNIKPAIIQGYSSVLNLLANKIIEKNVKITKPRLVFTDSELLLPEMRENIKKAFDTEIFDIYGTMETDNIAYECHYHKGYHITIDCVIMEFIKDGKHVNPNEEGEIVVTVLNNFAMPFIRYNFHDIGSYSGQPCPCGRTFPIMSQIKGRANDYMVTEDGRKISFTNIGNFGVMAPHVYEYQIIQDNVNSFTVFIVPGNSYNDEGKKIFTPAIKKFFPNASINIKLVSAIEREPSGKLRELKSNVKNI